MYYIISDKSRLDIYLTSLVYLVRFYEYVQLTSNNNAGFHDRKVYNAYIPFLIKGYFRDEDAVGERRYRIAVEWSL